MSEQASNQLILLEHVYSMEHYQKQEEVPVHVLKDISLEMKEGEIWAILGTSAFEVRLLLEIIANARPYQKGTCVLAKRGMMRKKRVVLPHVYYIGSTNMLFDNMTVLEYLMYMTAKDDGDVIDRQKKLLQDLLDKELGYVSLSEIKRLSPSERSVVTLMASLYTKSEIIIWNIARLRYDEQAMKAIQQICEEIKLQKRVLVFSSFDHAMIEQTADHIACMKQGSICYQGELQTLIEQYDHLSILIEDDRVDVMEQIISHKFQKLQVRRNHHCLELWDDTHQKEHYEQVLKELIRYEIYPSSIQVHEQCLSNAWKEVQLHDL